MLFLVVHIKQGKDESVCQYVDKFRRLVQQSNYPTASRKKPFVAGLNATFKDHVRSQRAFHLDVAVSMAIEFKESTLKIPQSACSRLKSTAKGAGSGFGARSCTRCQRPGAKCLTKCHGDESGVDCLFGQGPSMKCVNTL